MTRDIGDDLGTVDFTIVWDGKATSDDSLDLDLSGFALDAQGSVLSDDHFVFFNNGSSPGGAVVHTASGTDRMPSEKLSVNTAGLAPDVSAVAVAVTVYAETAGFRRFAKARITVQSSQSGRLAEYDLSVGLPDARAVVYAKVVNDQGVWRFHAVGEQFGSLRAVASSFGVNLG